MAKIFRNILSAGETLAYLGLSSKFWRQSRDKGYSANFIWTSMNKVSKEEREKKYISDMS